MGIYDREYYRGDGPNFLGSFSERARACKWLIGINIVFFLIQAATESGRDVGPFTGALQLNADAVLHGQVWRLLTYAFLHAPGNLMHIVFNMLFLWLFGADVEDLYGSKEFLAIYLVSAILGGLVFTLAWVTHLQQGLTCIGASGAVMAVMVLCAFHYPTRTVLLFLVIPVQIWLLVIISIGWDAYQFLIQANTRTAVTVHLAGAAFGFIYYKGHLRLTPLWHTLRDWQRQLFRPKLRIYRDESRQPVPVAAPQANDVDEHLEAKLDAVLEKVARYGKQSLTESENQILMRASEIYKRRRS